MNVRFGIARAAGGGELALRVLSVPAVAAGTYLAGLAALARPPRGGSGSRVRAGEDGGAPEHGHEHGREDESPFLAVVVPAHDEESCIGATVASLRSTTYPEGRRRIVVIADNCTDATAERARSAGAEVVERIDRARRSKGYALADVLPEVLADARVDGVVIVDADTLVSANLLEVAGRRLIAGDDAVQVSYGVRNPESSWRTRLMTIAFACFHDVRSLGRERLGVSCGLRGNGMVFSRAALERVPHRSHGLVEDAEHGIALAEAGIRVAYAHDAHVLGDMPVNGATAGSQRDRWEHGRTALRRQAVPKLLAHGARSMMRGDRRRAAMATDLAVDLLIPPLGQLVASEAAGLVASATLRTLSRRTARAVARRPWSVWLWSLALAAVGAHVAQGWRVSGTGRRGLRDLSMAPIYVGWKLLRRAQAVIGRRTSNTITNKTETARCAGTADTREVGQPVWVRTTRSGSSAPPTGRAS